jgi:glucan phosphorylase
VASNWERQQRRAWEIGYDTVYQRRELRAAAREADYDDLRARLEPLIDQRINEGDYASVGEIFADIYDQLAEDDVDPTEFLRGIFSPASV